MLISLPKTSALSERKGRAQRMSNHCVFQSVTSVVWVVWGQIILRGKKDVNCLTLATTGCFRCNVSGRPLGNLAPHGQLLPTNNLVNEEPTPNQGRVFFSCGTSSQLNLTTWEFPLQRNNPCDSCWGTFWQLYLPAEMHTQMEPSGCEKQKWFSKERKLLQDCMLSSSPGKKNQLKKKSRIFPKKPKFENAKKKF